MVNSALLQDATETAARSVISFSHQPITNANSFHRCLSSLAQQRMLSPKRNCIRHDRFLDFVDSRHLVYKLFHFFVLMLSLRYWEASDSERISTLWSGQFDQGSSSCLQVKRTSGAYNRHARCLLQVWATFSHCGFPHDTQSLHCLYLGRSCHQSKLLVWLVRSRSCFALDTLRQSHSTFVDL